MIILCSLSYVKWWRQNAAYRNVVVWVRSMQKAGAAPRDTGRYHTDFWVRFSARQNDGNGDNSSKQQTYKRRRRSHSVSVDSILAQQQILYYRHSHLLESLILYMCFDSLFLFLAKWMCASEREQPFGASSFLSGLTHLKIKFSFLDLFRCLSLSACDFPFPFYIFCIFRLASVAPSNGKWLIVGVWT